MAQTFFNTERKNWGSFQEFTLSNFSFKKYVTRSTTSHTEIQYLWVSPSAWGTSFYRLREKTPTSKMLEKVDVFITENKWANTWFFSNWAWSTTSELLTFWTILVFSRWLTTSWSFIKASCNSSFSLEQEKGGGREQKRVN